MKTVFISLTILHGLAISSTISQQSDRIHIRSHGDKTEQEQKAKAKLQERTYEAVLGLNISPRNRLRVRSRAPKDATDTILAAEAAGLKAKEIRQASKDRLSYRDLDSFETSLIPVYYSNGAAASQASTSVRPPRPRLPGLGGLRQAFAQTTTTSPPLVASTAASNEFISEASEKSRVPEDPEKSRGPEDSEKSRGPVASEKSRVPREAEASAEAEPQHKAGGSHAPGGHAPRSYTSYSQSSSGRTSSGDVRRTFNLHRGARHQSSHPLGSHAHGSHAPRAHPAPTSPPAPPPPPKVTTSYASTTSNPNLYYFKSVDSTSSSNIKPSIQTSSSTSYSTQVVENDNLALPGGYQPTYVVYPTSSKPSYSTSNPPNPTQYSSQKYLKPKKSSSPQYHPAGSYDAPKSIPAPKAPKQSIYREETAKFHPASLVHLPKPTSSYGVPPVQIADEDIRPRGTSGKRPPVFGYYPPSQRVMPRVNHMEAECSDDVMKLRVKFNDTFSGLIYSAGYSYDSDCTYINGTGENEYEFYIQLNRCGTLGGSDHNKKRDAKFKNTEPTKNYMWNTVTIQYNPLIEEEWDEHFKVTCEYGYDFWKTVTFPFLDVEVNTADPVHFTLTPPECHMEIRNGYGTSGARVAGPVHVGDPLTLMILMRSKWDGFDIVVNDCFAHNGANKRIPLIDHHGCPVDEKLISRFQGTWGMTNNMYDTLVYAHMKTFRFTGTPALYIECDIRMCHGKCPVQDCNWRKPKSAKKRSRRETNELSAEDLKVLNRSLSESVNLFQSIHVLQSREDELAFGNETVAEPFYDDVDSICVGSIVFAGVIGSLAFVALMSSVIVSLLCLKMKRLKDTEASVDNQINSKTDQIGVSGHRQRTAFIPGSGANSIANSIASLDTLRSRATIKSEYVHSAQARIP